MNDLVLVTFTILLPLIPAYILYKALPAETSVEGPFQGLVIKLSGAFAGYFLLVLVVIGFISSRPQPINNRYELWQVKGKINPEQTGNPIDPQRLRLSLVPANQTVNEDGSFDIQIAPEVVDKGKWKFPTLVINHPEFQTVTVDLNESRARFGQQVKKISMDVGSKEVVVDDPIGLQKKQQLPSYAPSGSAPQQAALSNDLEVKQ